jgi:ubiquinone/menaquinone biosynthesis C-methylase UbiE
MSHKNEPLEKHQAHVRYTADQYDQYTASFVKPFDDALCARVVKEALPRLPNALLLDVGTGTARFLVHMAQQESKISALSSLRLVGTDLFADMIEQARQTVAAAGYTKRVELLQQDVHKMELPDEFADIIISRSTLHHWSDPTRALTEIYRLLKPGGIAIIHDVRRDPAPEAIAEFNRMRALAGLGPSYLDEKFTAAEVQAFLVDAGLAPYGEIHAPVRGLGALGLAVEITKPASEPQFAS